MVVRLFILLQGLGNYSVAMADNLGDVSEEDDPNIAFLQANSHCLVLEISLAIYGLQCTPWTQL